MDDAEEYSTLKANSKDENAHYRLWFSPLEKKLVYRIFLHNLVQNRSNFRNFFSIGFFRQLESEQEDGSS